MDVRKMVDDYLSWMKSEIRTSKIGEYYEITTPYLDRFNDYLQIYIKQLPDGQYVLTDDGYTISNLKSSGMNLRNNSRRAKMIDNIIHTFSVVRDGDDITTMATDSSLPVKKHLMVQAMLAIDDLYEANEENVKSMFAEDVQLILDRNNIFYTRDISLIGKSGSVNTFNFSFQRTASKPERFCKLLDKMTETNRNLTLFNWIDTRDKRGNKGQLLTVINDTAKAIKPADKEAFSQYSIIPVPFSEMQSKIDLFAS